MGIARSTFYHEPIRQDRQVERDMALRGMIEQIHVELPGYGYRRVRQHLLNQGKRVNTKRIRRVMKTYSLFSCIKKLMRPRGAAAGVKLCYPNLVRGITLNGPNQVWATDITYIKLIKEYVYVSAVIDVYTRKIVGWSVSRDLSHKFCLDSLEVAIKKQKPPPGVIHHSDRGIQYTSIDYIGFLQKHGFNISMSRLATPEDNAYIESFFKTMKREEVFFKDYKVISEVIENLPRFIDQVYNRKRLHSSLGYKTPEAFEKEVMSINPADRPIQKLWGWTV